MPQPRGFPLSVVRRSTSYSLSALAVCAAGFALAIMTHAGCAFGEETAAAAGSHWEENGGSPIFYVFGPFLPAIVVAIVVGLLMTIVKVILRFLIHCVILLWNRTRKETPK